MAVVLSTKLRSPRQGVYQHWCPACRRRHDFDVGQPNAGGAVWTWNGDAERPTFSPSMHMQSQRPLANGGLEVRTLCHYFLTDGVLTYCGDSPHALSGQTVPLPDFPEWVHADGQS